LGRGKRCVTEGGWEREQVSFFDAFEEEGGESAREGEKKRESESTRAIVQQRQRVSGSAHEREGTRRDFMCG